MASRILTPFGRATNNFSNDGNIHLGGAPNVVSLPGVTPQRHPIMKYYDMLGVPDKLKNMPTDQLPVTSATIASAFDGEEPEIIRNYVIEATLDNALYQHFAVCTPVDVKGKMKGIGAQILRFNISPLSSQPEGTSGTFIRHRFEKTKVKLKRWGQALEIWDDWSKMPDGQAIYEAYLRNIATNTTYSGMMAVMTALLHAYEPKKSWMQQYAPNYPSSGFQDLGDMNRMFGGFHKREKFIYQLSDHAAQVSRKMTTGDKFTHCFLTTKAARQVALADEFNHNFYQHGPGNMEYLKNGSDGIMTMPNGTKIVIEPDSYLDGTELREGEALQLLRQKVTTGRFNVSLLDRTIVGAVDRVVPKRDLGISYLNMDMGNGEIVHQDIKDLIRAMICWGRNGELHRSVYNHLTSGQNAEKEAQKMGIRELNRANDGATLLDVFIAEHVGGVRLPVHIVGNMHSAYMDNDAQNCIAKSAAFAVKEEMSEDEIKAMRVAIKFAQTNKNVLPTSLAARAFAYASVIPVVVGGGGGLQTNGQRYPLNVYGVYDVPSLGQVQTAFDGLAGRGGGNYGLDDTVVFPGFSTIKHLRTVRDFAIARGGDWYSANGLSSAARNHLSRVADGVDALLKFAAICKRIWSPASAKNTFFRKEALPTWNRTQNATEDETDAFIQNIVLGIGYPTGLVTDAGVVPNNATDRDLAYFDFRTDADVTDERVLDFVNIVVGQVSIPVSLASWRQRLQTSVARGMFGSSLPLFFPANLRRSNNGDSERVVLENLFADLVIRDAEGTETTGLDGLMAIINARLARATVTSEDVQWLLDAHVKGLSAMRELLENKREGRAAGVKVTIPSPEVVKTLANVRILAQRALTAESEPESSAQAARNAVSGLRPDGPIDNRNVATTTLSFSGEAWRRAYTGRTADELLDMTLVAADPMQPGTWLGRNARSNATQASRDFTAMAARAQFSIDETCMGKTAGALFVDNVREAAAAPATKRAYVPSTFDAGDFGSESSMSAGASFFYEPEARDPYEGVPASVRQRMELDASGDLDTPRVDLNNPYQRGPHRRAVSGVAQIQEANAHFDWRWRHAVDNFASDIILLAQHLLLLGTRVHRDSFVNLVENGVPAPVGLITADPFITFTMTHAVFARAGCGNLYYSFPSMANNYDANHKVLRCFLTVWMKAHVHLPEDVFVAENVAFDTYVGGGDGSLIRDIYVEDPFASAPPGGYGYDPANPETRRGNRFVLPVGVSTQVKDIPNPLPLNGTFAGNGAYHGMGKFINTQNGGPRRTGFAYDSALVANFIAKFYQLSRRVSPSQFQTVASFVERTDIIGAAFNTVCYKADQWARDHGDGGYKRPVQTGDGPLEQTSEGVMVPYGGKIGLAQYYNAHARK